ncbi:hypothetical protein [Paenibacillus naphthalenovorans]|uniref:hypothetical protein n=1 Tax=Paenibacillus naphthalenovorans TaxID=162209 RepID=UPI003D2B4B09
MNIEHLLRRLSVKRPLFHNEADFQHALAWEIREQEGGTIRLERRMDVGNQKVYLDIWFEKENRKYAIELKYKVKTLEHTLDNEKYSLSNHGAQDIGRYDVLKDLYRIEQLVITGQVDEGFVIFLTNDPSYYLDPVQDKPTADRDFRIHEGKQVHGLLNWGEGTGDGTMKGREEAISVIGNYKMHWSPYSRLDHPSNGNFKVLVLHVRPDQLREQTVPKLNNNNLSAFHQLQEDNHEEEINYPAVPWLQSFLHTKPILKSQIDLRDKLAECLEMSGYRLTVNRDIGPFKVDIWAEKDEECLALEVRYKTAALRTIHQRKIVELKQQGAHDISRYDFVKDIEKLERVTETRPNVHGYAILLTNDHLYWQPSRRINVVDEAFHISEGHRLQGTLAWKEHAGAGTTTGREKAVHLKAAYRMEWNSYLSVGDQKNGEFKILLVKVGNDNERRALDS